MERSTQTSRRGMIGRAAAAIGALAGVEALRASRADASPAKVRTKTSTLELRGRGFHLHTSTSRPGMGPAKGDRMTGYGELLTKDGAVAGHFSSSYLALDSPFATPGSLELHVLTLERGTIHGIGSTAGEEEGHFSIIGGTGEFARVRGTYVAHQEPRELGGDGFARFLLTLHRQES